MNVNDLSKALCDASVKDTGKLIYFDQKNKKIITAEKGLWSRFVNSVCRGYTLFRSSKVFPVVTQVAESALQNLNKENFNSHDLHELLSNYEKFKTRVKFGNEGLFIELRKRIRSVILNALKIGSPQKERNAVLTKELVECDDGEFINFTENALRNQKDNFEFWQQFEVEIQRDYPLESSLLKIDEFLHLDPNDFNKFATEEITKFRRMKSWKDLIRGYPEISQKIQISDYLGLSNQEFELFINNIRGNLEKWENEKIRIFGEPLFLLPNPSKIDSYFISKNCELIFKNPEEFDANFKACVKDLEDHSNQLKMGYWEKMIQAFPQLSSNLYVDSIIKLPYMDFVNKLDGFIKRILVNEYKKFYKEASDLITKSEEEIIDILLINNSRLKGLKNTGNDYPLKILSFFLSLIDEHFLLNFISKKDWKNLCEEVAKMRSTEEVEALIKQINYIRSNISLLENRPDRIPLDKESRRELIHLLCEKNKMDQRIVEVKSSIGMLKQQPNRNNSELEKFEQILIGYMQDVKRLEGQIIALYEKKNNQQPTYRVSSSQAAANLAATAAALRSGLL